MTTTRYCTCEVPDATLVEGVQVCSGCGERVPDPRDRLLALVARQQAEILARLKGLERDHEEGAPGRLLNPPQLARQIGKSPQWIREHTEELGGVRVGDGPRPRYFFDLERAREQLAARSTRSEPESQPKPNPRRRRSSNGTRLLPVKDRTAA